MHFLQHVIDALTLGSAYALYALGIALIFGIMGLINFAHGELVMVGAYTLVLIGHVTWPVLIVATLGVAIVFALAMERVAFRPLRGANPATLLISSFAVSYLLQNLAILIEGSAPKGTSVSPWLSQSYSVSSRNSARPAGPAAAMTMAAILSRSNSRRTRPSSVTIRVCPRGIVAMYTGSPPNDVISSSLTSSPERRASASRGFTVSAAIGTLPRIACGMPAPAPRPALASGNGSIDNIPLNAHVAAPKPKINPRIMCQRFWPRYGMLESPPEWR